MNRSWLLLLSTLGLLGAAGSVEILSAIPGAIAGLAGGHAIFLLALGARSLRSTALTVQPMSFRRAVWAVTRLPLLFSVTGMVVPAP